MKKIWIISEFYYPYDNTTSYIITKISEGLGEKTEINVITSTASNRKGVTFEKINNVFVNRVKDSGLDKNNFFKRIIKLTLLGLRLFIKSLFLIKRNDTLLVVTNPATIIFLTRILRIFIKFNLIFLVHDVFPENLVIAKVINPNNLLYRLTLYLYDWAYLKADKIIVIGRDMYVFMKNKLGHKCPPVVYIPNFVDVNEIIPHAKEQNILLQKYSLTNKFVLLYTGNLGRAQDIDNILKTMELLKQEENIHLLMIGDGANTNFIKKFIREKSLRNITLLPAMKREFSNVFLNAGDIGLVSLQPGRKGIAVPSKSYTFLAAAKPILAIVDKESEIYLMINESGCGWWSEPGNPVTLKDLICEISKMDDELKIRSQKAYNLALEKYSIEKIIPQFHMNLLM